MLDRLNADELIFVVRAWAFLQGAVIGSFLNVVIYRLPLEMSLIRPLSTCPSCKSRIRPWDNVPILAWFWLRGRCRDCAARISIRYPCVELAGGLIGLATVWKFGLGLAALEVAIFAWVSLALMLIDYDHHLLLDVLTYPSIVFGLTMSWFGGLVGFTDAALGAAVGAFIPAAIIIGYKALRGVEGMGWGDVKFLAAIGSVVGLAGCLEVLILGAASGAIVGAGMMLRGKGDMQTALPFGTFLALGLMARLFLPLPSLVVLPPF